MSDDRDRDDDEPYEAPAAVSLDPASGIDADPADVLEQAQPLTAVGVGDLADGSDLPFADPAEDARLEEDAREAEPPA